MPKSFSDLDKKELYRAAIEDFAVEVNEKDSVQTIRAALLESGVTWADYVAQHPEVAPKEEEMPKANPGVITSSDVKGATAVVPVVMTAAPAVPEQEALYLVKMNRKNPYFEFGRYKFSTEHPYVVMDADATNRILVEEEGFAIATPAEAADYYK